MSRPWSRQRSRCAHRWGQLPLMSTSKWTSAKLNHMASMHQGLSQGFDHVSSCFIRMPAWESTICKCSGAALQTAAATIMTMWPLSGRDVFSHGHMLNGLHTGLAELLSFATGRGVLRGEEVAAGRRQGRQRQRRRRRAGVQWREQWRRQRRWEQPAAVGAAGERAG